MSSRHKLGPSYHTYVKRKQAASFKSLVEGCDGKSVVLQVDFSENATIASQREVQSAHWNHGQATLFTAHAWIKAGSGDTEPAEGRSMVIVSDELNHTKYSIYVFMQHVFRYLKTTFPNIEQINVFSDGPTSQFKQRFLFFESLCLGDGARPKNHVEFLHHLSRERCG